MSEHVDQEFIGAWRYAPLDPACDVLLVGEDNPQSSDPKDALFPYPINAAGYNFAENIADVGSAHHLETWRTNLCCPKWSAPEARKRARQLVETDGVPWRVIVMLGAKVHDAFVRASVMPEMAPFEVTRTLHRIHEGTPTMANIDWITLLYLPHPSGRCRVWNDQAAIFRARASLAAIAPAWYGECNT